MKYVLLVLASIGITHASELHPVDGRCGKGWNHWWSFLQSNAYADSEKLNYGPRGAQRVALLKESLASSTFLAVSELKDTDSYLVCYAKTLRGLEPNENLESLPLEIGHTLISKELAAALNTAWLNKLKKTRYHLNSGQEAVFDGEACTLGGTSQDAPFLYFMGAFNLPADVDLKWISEVGSHLIDLIKSKDTNKKSSVASRIIVLLEKHQIK
ncbi:MAG: hypothetical protein V4662_20925 [Verrucomicrobiota bacterium]